MKPEGVFELEYEYEGNRSDCSVKGRKGELGAF